MWPSALTAGHREIVRRHLSGHLSSGQTEKVSIRLSRRKGCNSCDDMLV